MLGGSGEGERVGSTNNPERMMEKSPLRRAYKIDPTQQAALDERMKSIGRALLCSAVTTVIVACFQLLSQKREKAKECKQVVGILNDIMPRLPNTLFTFYQPSGLFKIY